MERIYLDHAATTPVDPRVYEAMLPFFTEEFGNPSGLYQEGVRARAKLTEAREMVSRCVGARTEEIFFTGGGTESDNCAVLGVVAAAKKKGVHTPHVIVSAIEHPAILEPVRVLEQDGVIEVTMIPVDENGIVDPKEVKAAVREETVLVSIMYANSEVGTIQPIRDIVRSVHGLRSDREVLYPYIHTDACQATNYCDMSVEKLGVDLMTFNGSKIYGPKGVGALYVRNGIDIAPIIHGGGQERGLRSGTENVAAIVGLAEALRIVEDMKQEESQRLSALRDHSIERILARIPGAILNGDRERRLPNNVHITIPDIEDDVLVIELDARGIACSSKSACKSSSEIGSHVIFAMKGEVRGSHVRLSLGRTTTRECIERTIDALCDVVRKYGGEIR